MIKESQIIEVAENGAEGKLSFLPLSKRCSSQVFTEEKYDNPITNKMNENFKNQYILDILINIKICQNIKGKKYIQFLT